MAIYIIVLLTFLVHIGFAGSRLVVPLYAVDQGASPFVVGSIVSVYAALPAVLALPAGRLTDRLGFTGPLVFGTGGVLAALLLPFLWPSIPTLYFTVCLLGVAFMAFQLATQTLAGAIAEPAERARNFSWVSLGFASANFTGPLLAGFLVDQIGHARTFAAIAIPLVPATLFAIFSSRWLPDVHTKSSKVSGGALDLLRIKPLRDTLIASGLVSAAWDLYQFFMPIYGRSVGLSATAIGSIMAGFAIAIIVVRLGLPWAVKRTSELRMLTYSMFVAAFSYLLFPLFQTPWPLAVVSFVLGLGCGCGQPLSLTLIYNASPQGRVGEANGLRITVNQLTHFVIPLVFGALGTAAGLSPVFLTNAVFLAGGGLISKRNHV